MKPLEPSFSDQMSFFLNVAVIGATLFGLTLVALVGFLPLHVERFKQAALAAFPDSKIAAYTRGANRLSALSDKEIVDGDPLVFFTAYSMGTSWSFFTLPIALGLTMAWPIKHLFVCGVEIVLLTGLLGWALWGRNMSLKKMSVYMTNEERAWPSLSVVVLILLFSSAVFIGVIDISAPKSSWLAVGTIKGICISSLMLGSYVLNKEVFVYFKANALERLRAAWLSDFLESFPRLESDVRQMLSNEHVDPTLRSSLAEQWHNGIPDLKSAHDEFRSGEDVASLEQMWQSMRTHGAGAYAWTIDVPQIASWSNKVSDRLREAESSIGALSASPGRLGVTGGRPAEEPHS